MQKKFYGMHSRLRYSLRRYTDKNFYEKNFYEKNFYEKKLFFFSIAPDTIFELRMHFYVALNSLNRLLKATEKYIRDSVTVSGAIPTKHNVILV